MTNRMNNQLSSRTPGASGWTDDELARIGDATELELASRRPDGTLRSFTTMWVVRVGDDLYVRSAGGGADRAVVPACPRQRHWPDPRRRDRA